MLEFTAYFGKWAKFITIEKVAISCLEIIMNSLAFPEAPFHDEICITLVTSKLKVLMFFIGINFKLCASFET